MNTKHIAFILILIAVSGRTEAQTVVEGTVTDSLGMAVEAYVTVSPKGTGSIIGFADTDAKGNYKLEIKTTADSLTLG